MPFLIFGPKNNQNLHFLLRKIAIHGFHSLFELFGNHSWTMEHKYDIFQNNFKNGQNVQKMDKMSKKAKIGQNRKFWQIWVIFAYFLDMLTFLDILPRI